MDTSEPPMSDDERRARLGALMDSMTPDMTEEQFETFCRAVEHSTVPEAIAEIAFHIGVGPHLTDEQLDALSAKIDTLTGEQRAALWADFDMVMVDLRDYGRPKWADDEEWRQLIGAVHAMTS